MLIRATAAVAAVFGLRALVHRGILRGLRAPRLPHDRTPADLGVPPEAVVEATVPGPGGRRLFGWLLRPAVDAGVPVPAMLLMHGWGANAGTMLDAVPPLREAGYAVLLLDARCHGRSDDEAFTSMPRFAEDIAAGLAWLRACPGVDAGRLALMGHSVGAAAAVLHASRHDDVRAVVSLSAFAHPQELMRRYLAERGVPYPVIGWYVMRHVQRTIGTSFDAIAPLHTLARVRCPVLLVHGTADATVPFEDARRLAAVCAAAALLPVDGGHDLRGALIPHAPALISFLDAACGRSGDVAAVA
jgi:pimeloyl-ACP methyl ester carboxylesterase